MLTRWLSKLCYTVVAKMPHRYLGEMSQRQSSKSELLYSVQIWLKAILDYCRGNHRGCPVVSFRPSFESHLS